MDLAVRNILKCYLRNRKINEEGGCIIVPTGGLIVMDCVQKFGSFSLVLIGDKGFTSIDEFVGFENPHVALHGSFSFMVNFDLIMRCMSDQYDSNYAWPGAVGNKCVAVHTPYKDGFKTYALYYSNDNDDNNSYHYHSKIHTDNSENDNSETLRLRTVFRRSIASFSKLTSSFGPDQFSTFQRIFPIEIENHVEKLFPTLALLRLSCFDNDVFMKQSFTLIKQSKLLFNSKSKSKLTIEEYEKDLSYDLDKVVSNDYFLKPDEDVFFEIARIYMAIHQYEYALDFFQKSLKKFGRHHVTFHNIGLCYFHMQMFQKAQNAFKSALSEEPTYQESKEWHAKTVEKSFS